MKEDILKSARYEYKIENLYMDDKLEAALNLLGRNGWEFVKWKQIDLNLFKCIFKRIVVEAE